MQKPGITSKLLKIFLTQLGLISAVALLGIFAAAFVTEEVLVKQALQGEAEYFWQRYRENPNASLPNTLNLMAYMSPQTDIPNWLQNLPEGLHRTQYNGHQPIVHVSTIGENTLYLVFNEKQVSRLSLFFGITPLALVLVVLYALAYFSYSLAKRALSPILQVAEKMESFNVDHYEDSPLDFENLKKNADAETSVLIESIEQFLNRLQDFITRERNFTRYASHELRTPLSVIRGSVDNLKAQQCTDKQARQISRIEKTAREMESLLETLLLLAREENQATKQESILVNDAAALIVDQYNLTNSNPDVDILLQQKSLLQVECPDKVLRILIGNLISNGLSHTESGSVIVNVDVNEFSVSDTGSGIKPEALTKIFAPFYRENQQQGSGFGLGLSIVQKICDQYGWKISVSSEIGKGSTFTVHVGQPA